MVKSNNLNMLKERFRGFYPVVIDIETSGFNQKTDAILEIAIFTLKMDSLGWILSDKQLHFHIEPFIGSILTPESLAFTGIDPSNPLRGAISEYDALNSIFRLVRSGMKNHSCKRAIVVAHNATFDLNFLMAAVERNGIQRNPFHPFATFDTAALSGLVLGETVLAKACKAAGIEFDNKQAHSALYDSEQTTILFCELVNRWKRLGGWPLSLLKI